MTILRGDLQVLLPNHLLPRVRQDRIPFCGPSDYPTPDGFITGCELLEYLVPIWWGDLFCELEIIIEGHSVTPDSRLGNAATTGQVRECVLVVQNAGEDAALEGLIPHSAADPVPDEFHRITPGDWS